MQSKTQISINIYSTKTVIVICLKLEHESRESGKTGGRRWRKNRDEEDKEVMTAGCVIENNDLTVLYFKECRIFHRRR